MLYPALVARLNGALLFVSLTSTLAACDSSNGKTPTSQLSINEVGSSYYGDAMRWFEVYNTGPTALDLGRYKLRSRYTDETHIYADHTFTLPSVTINAGQYLIIRAQSWYTPYSDTDRVVHLKENGLYPYWDSEGYLELLDASSGATVDFIAFGANYAPTHSHAWSGDPATLVSTKDSGGESIGRDVDGTDTNAAGDWTNLQIDFSGYSDWVNNGQRSPSERRSERFLRLPDPVGNDRVAQVIKEPAPPQHALPSHYFLRQQREQAQP